MTFQIFGSKSSTDVDLVVFVKEVPSTMKAAADICYALKQELPKKYNFDRPLNVNIATITNGIIASVHKGTIDELNNSLYHTYHLHQQFFPQQIIRLLPRDIDLKMLRCARKILSFLSRTTARIKVKAALKNNFSSQIESLRLLPLNQFSDFGSKGNSVDFKKMLAFQLGQTIALLKGEELYTKEAIFKYFPSIQAHLMRLEDAPIEALQILLDQFILFAKERIPQMQRDRE